MEPRTESQRTPPTPSIAGLRSRLKSWAKACLRPVATKLRGFFTAPIQGSLNELQRVAEMRNLQWQAIDAINIRLSRLDRLLRMFLTQCPPPAGGPELPPLANDDPLSRIEQYALLAAQRAITYCNPQEMLVRTKIGHVVCSPNDLAVISYLSGGDPEPGTRMLIEKLLQPGDTYIDVGANLGIHTLAAARAMKNSGRIIAFEPFPETAKLLKKTMFINGGSSIFELHEAAVSNIEGKQRLYLGQTCGHHSLFAHDESGQNSLNQIEVKVVKLDDILPETTRPTLIKIDAEGAELSVIEGAHSLLSRNPDVALIAEFGRPHLVLTGQSPSNWLRRFEDLGFFCRKINADTGALESFSCVDSMDSETANLVFARRNSVAWNRLAFSRCAA